MPLSEFSAYVAIDWADQHHCWRLADAEGKYRDHGDLRNTPEAIDTWVAGLGPFRKGSIARGTELAGEED